MHSGEIGWESARERFVHAARLGRQRQLPHWWQRFDKRWRSQTSAIRKPARKRFGSGSRTSISGYIRTLLNRPLSGHSRWKDPRSDVQLQKGQHWLPSQALVHWEWRNFRDNHEGFDVLSSSSASDFSGIFGPRQLRERKERLFDGQTRLGRNLVFLWDDRCRLVSIQYKSF